MIHCVGFGAKGFVAVMQSRMQDSWSEVLIGSTFTRVASGALQTLNFGGAL